MEINKISSMSKEEIERKIAEINWDNYREAAKNIINPFVPHGTFSELLALQKLVRGNQK